MSDDNWIYESFSVNNNEFILKKMNTSMGKMLFVVWKLRIVDLSDCPPHLDKVIATKIALERIEFKMQL